MGYSGRMNLAAAIFNVPVVDYRRARYGLLIGSGAGSMMAVMDATDRFRFALDIDQLRGREDDLCGWVKALDKNDLVDLVALCGWFSITNPIKIARTLASLVVPTIVYSGAGLCREMFANVPFVETLDDFFEQIEERFDDNSRRMQA